MKRFLIIFFALSCIYSLQADIAKSLSEKILQSPNQKFHVLAKCSGKSIQEIIDSVEGPKKGKKAIAKVAFVFVQDTKRLHQWLAEFPEAENLKQHQAIRAVSFEAPGSFIVRISENERVAHICELPNLQPGIVNTQQVDLLKPDDIFLQDNDYWNINSCRVVKVANTEQPKQDMVFGTLEEPKSGGTSIDIDKIINILEKVWAFIKAGKPVVNNQKNVASAVPQGLQNPGMEMTGWRNIHTDTYIFTAENVYGFTVCEFAYYVRFSANGNYEGKGKYITNATTITGKIDVAWGWTFNVNANIPDTSVLNIGTKENPIAQLSCFVHFSLESLLSHIEREVETTIDGSGNWEFRFVGE